MLRAPALVRQAILLTAGLFLIATSSEPGFVVFRCGLKLHGLFKARTGGWERRQLRWEAACEPLPPYCTRHDVGPGLATSNDTADEDGKGHASGIRHSGAGAHASAPSLPLLCFFLAPLPTRERRVRSVRAWHPKHLSCQQVLRRKLRSLT